METTGVPVEDIISCVKRLVADHRQQICFDRESSYNYKGQVADFALFGQNLDTYAYT